MVHHHVVDCLWGGGAGPRQKWFLEPLPDSFTCWGSLPSAPSHHVTSLSHTTQNPQPVSRGSCDLVSLHSPKLHSISTQGMLGGRHPALLSTSGMCHLGRLGLMPLHARCWPAATHPLTSGLCPAVLSPGLLHRHKTLFPSKSYCLPEAFLNPTESQLFLPKHALFAPCSSSALVYMLLARKSTVLFGVTLRKRCHFNSHNHLAREPGRKVSSATIST